MKKCCDCKQEKPLEAFSKDSKNPDGLRYRCRECASLRWKRQYDSRPEFWRAKSSAWAKKNPEKKKRIQKDADLKAKYGISLIQFESMLAEQGGKCAICKVPLTAGKANYNCAHTDHNHLTGKVRGILCRCCNHMLGDGGAKESILTLQAAISYLLKFRG